MSFTGSTKRIYIDMDGVVANFEKGVEAGKIDFPHVKYQQSRYGFFINLEPLPNAIETIAELNKHDIFDIWFLTRPSMDNLSCYSEKALWIQNHFGLDFVKKLILSPDKSLLIGDYLIDDCEFNANQNQFKGKFLLFNTKQAKEQWNMIKQYFTQMYLLK